MKQAEESSRRKFIGETLAVTSALALTGFAFKPDKEVEKNSEGLFMIGPKPGYTPLIGTLVSMLENMTGQVKENIKDLTLSDLDYQYDDKSNSIAALILHIVSSEKFHQIGVLEGRPLNADELKFWEPARKLGEPARKAIKGKEINYYINIMDEVREYTLAGLRQKDDEWLLQVDPLISTTEIPINRFWRLFHACEHMSNHNGQIKFLKSRLP